jgi:hypothetical protein
MFIVLATPVAILMVFMFVVNVDWWFALSENKRLLMCGASSGNGYKVNLWYGASSLG